MKIGLPELIVIFIVALVVIGPDKLPFYAKKLGEALAQFKKYSDEATKEIKEGIIDPLEEAQRPLKEAMQPLEDLDKTLRGNVKDVKKSFSSIGKEKKEVKEAAEEAANEEVQETKEEETQEIQQEVTQEVAQEINEDV